MNPLLSFSTNLLMLSGRKYNWLWIAIALILIVSMVVLFTEPSWAGPAPSGSYCGSC